MAGFGAKVKLSVDRSGPAKQEFNNQISSMVNQIKISHKFVVLKKDMLAVSKQIQDGINQNPIQIKKIDVSGAVKSLRVQLQSMLDSLSIKNGVTISGLKDPGGDKTIQTTMQNITLTADQANAAIARFNAQMVSLKTQTSILDSAFKSVSNSEAALANPELMAEIRAKYDEWISKIELVKQEHMQLTPELMSQYQQEVVEIQKLIATLREKGRAAEEEARRQANAEKEAAAAEEAAAKQRELDAAEYRSQLDRVNTALTQAKQNLASWSTAKFGTTSSSYRDIENQVANLERLRMELISSGSASEDFGKRFGNAVTRIRAASESIKAAGENTRTFSERIGTLAQKFSAWLSVSQVIMLVVRSIRQMISATIDLDDAMTQLRIVTNTTEQAYSEYLDTISQTATKIGSSISDLVDSTTTFARLGYSLDESSRLAEYTAMLQNVGDIDVADAQDAITSIFKAFEDIDIDNIEEVMDKLIITGNNFPISVSQIAEGMNNASSALAAAGNTFEESVALLTAANTTIQNAAKSSTGLRTIAARLRNTKTELDELGETMTDATYGELIAALTKYNVQLTDMNGEFRSTYDIIADLAKVWDKLGSMEQAGLATAISGTRQQAVFFSLVEQFKEAEGAMEDMANSAGTLQQSYGEFMESTTAHINQFKAAFEGLSQASFTTDFLNGIIDAGTDLIGILNTIMKLIDAVGGLNTVLYTTVGIISVIKAESIIAFLGKAPTMLMTLAGGLGKVGSALSMFLGLLTASQAEQAMFAASAGQTSSTLGLLTAALNKAGIAASTTQVAFAGAFAAIGVLVFAYNKHKMAVEEATSAMKEAASAATDERKTIDELISEYQRLAESENFDDSTRESIRRIQEEITKLVGDQANNLDLVNGKLADQIEKLDEIRYKSAVDNRNALETSYLDAKKQVELGTGARDSGANFLGVVPLQGTLEEILRMIGYVDDRLTGPNGMLNLDMTQKDAQEILDIFKDIQNVLLESEEWRDYADDLVGLDTESILNTVQSQIDTYQGIVDEFNNAQKEYFDNQAIIDTFEYLKNNDIDSQKSFDEYIDSIKNSAEYSKEYKEALIDAASNAFPQYTNAVEEATNSNNKFGESLAADSTDKIADTLASMKSSYDAMNQAIIDMASTGSVSTDTIKALADEEANYLDYLYEENGVIKLNTEAWIARTKAKGQGEVDTLRQETEALQEQRKGLFKDISDYEKNQAVSADGGIWNQLIEDAKAKIEEIDNLIAQNNTKIALYASQLEQPANARAVEEIESRIKQIQSESDALDKRNKAIEESLPTINSYIETINKANEMGITEADTKFGNIDTNNRQVLEWTEANVKAFEDALKSWGLEAADMLGSISTVLGSSAEFDGIEIAFSPMLQTDDGPVLLDRNTVDKYIFALIDKAAEEHGGKWSSEDLFNLDATGLEVEGRKISNLLAAIGDSAIGVSEAMHFTGTDGALKLEERALQEAGQAAGLTKEQVDALADEFAKNAAAAQANSEEIDSLNKRITELGSLNPLNIISSLEVIEENIHSIGEAIGKFSENGRLTSGDFAGLLDVFGNYESFENFARVLSNTKSSMEDVQQAANSLAEEYINSIGILDNLTESNAALTEAELTGMGVTNAHEVVMNRLRAAELNAKASTLDKADATWTDTQQTLQNIGATNSDIAAVQNLRLQQLQARVAAIDFATASASVTGTLLQQAKAAGVASNALASLYKLQQRKAAGKLDEYEANNYGDMVDRLQRQIEGDISDVMAGVTVPTVSVSVPKISSSGSSGRSSGGSGSGSSTKTEAKEVEKYTVEIERFREALERLNRIRINKDDINLKLENTDDLQEKIDLENQLIDVYSDERDAIWALNSERENAIKSRVESLRGLGFDIDYNPDGHKLFIKNMERINELNADSKGSFETLQEATNEYRKDIEEQIKELEEWNQASQEEADTFQELGYSIRTSKINIVNDLKEIVTQASDVVDTLQNVYDTLKAAADEYAANGGFISIDTFQSIVALGPEYMQYLRDENGLLVINEDKINDVIAAKTRQLAVDTAMSYVERLRLATQKNSIEDLNNLIYATTEATDATWAMVYANLAALDLTDDQYQQALHNIEAIRSLAENAAYNIKNTVGSAKEELENMKSGLDDILKYVMEMLKQRIQNQIDALEDMKTKYAEIIDLKKESLDATKEESDYQDEIADKIKEIADLQRRIDALSLDDSRDSQAERAKLMEQMGDLQKDLADQQNEHAVDKQKESLDEMQEAYEEEKDKEIDVLEESISSQEKLYRMAIEYIKTHWDTLYQELIDWNTEYGSVLNSEITTAWENALAAAQRYGDYVTALGSIDADIASMGGSSGGSYNNTVVGQSWQGSSSGSSDRARAVEDIIQQMRENGRAWGTASDSGKKRLSDDSLQKGAQLRELGVPAWRGDDGVWYVGDNKDLLFEKYKSYCYHTGGVAGDSPTLKQSEIMAKLEKGEAVLDQVKQDGLFRLMDFVSVLSKKFDKIALSSGISNAMRAMRINTGDTSPSNITNNDNESIHFGDVYIYGASDETVEKHKEVNRKFANDILEFIRTKR